METELKLGDRVRGLIRNGEMGTVEEFRTKDGMPLIRWDYGQLLATSPMHLEVIEK